METERGTAAATPPTPDALHNLCLADPVWAERYDGWTELGHGGSASVVRTKSRATGEEIALKVFPRLSADEWRRYQDEVRNAQRLTSPYIVRVYSPFPRRTFAWIEMEWVEGPNLRQELERLAPEPMPLPRVLEVGTALARALVAAHAEGLIHRDVKPANILLPASGRPAAKLGDFGLSRLTDATRLTRSGLLVGTPQFAAPEVIEGRTAGPASDVYASCLCLYLMLTGNRAPFDVEDPLSPMQWMRAHADQAPRPLHAHQGGVPEALATLVDRGLDKTPENRPTAAALLRAFETMTGESRGASGAHPAPRRPWSGGTAMATVVGIVAVATIVLRGRVIAPTAPPEPTAASPAAAVTAAAAVERSPIPAPPAPETTGGATLPPVVSPSPLLAELRGAAVLVRNTAARPISRLTITIVTAAGSRHVARPPETLGAGEDLYLALEEFSPLPPASLRGAKIAAVAD
jgi:serine/threonine-protein kinase